MRPECVERIASSVEGSELAEKIADQLSHFIRQFAKVMRQGRIDP